MPYQVDRFNGTFLVSVADGTVDTTTDLRFLGKNYAGYGEVQNENFLHLLENFANTSPPPKAINGQVWYDSASKRLKYYDADNTKWRTTGSLEVGATAPTKMNVGDFWYDTSADQLYSWNGTTFVLIGPQPNIGGNLTATSVAIVPGKSPALNYNIVKLYAGSSNVVAVVSNDEFEVDFTTGVESTTDLGGFQYIKKGINLPNTDNVTGVTNSDLRFWGTSANALRLGGVLASEFIQRTTPAFTSQVSFTNAGFTVGSPGNNLAVFIELGDQPVIESRNSARVTVRIRENQNTAHDIMEFVAPGANPGAAIPGLDSAYNLGTPIYKWSNVYANTYNGNLIGNVTGNTVGSHKGNLVANDDSVAFNAATKNFTGTFTGILTGNVIGDVTGTSSNAFTLNNLQSSVETQASTIVVRDTSGNINAGRFIGTADKANELLVSGLGYRTALTTPTANSIVVRDGNGNINVNLVNGTATAANTIQADNAGYVTASTAAVGNTVVVRDFAGRINVTGINGSATSADQLQVDGTTYRLASTSAISNTIAARDSTGTLRATSLENTPVGVTVRNTGAFTTLTASGVTTITNNTAAVDKVTGALVVTGGVGVGGSVHATAFYGNLVGNVTGNVSGTVTGGINGPVGAGTPNTGAFTTLTANNNVTFTKGTDSSSTTTGTVVITGGLGVSGTIHTNGFVQSSSIALKENVSPISNGLDAIMSLVGVTYDRKDTQKHEAGLIAEEVAKVIPEVVSLDKEGKPVGIQYTNLVAYLIEAVKSLKDEIDTLKGVK